MPLSHQRALSAEPEEIMYMTAGDVGVYYDDSGETTQYSYHAVFAQEIYLTVVIMTCLWACTLILLIEKVLVKAKLSIFILDEKNTVLF